MINDKCLIVIYLALGYIMLQCICRLKMTYFKLIFCFTRIKLQSYFKLKNGNLRTSVLSYFITSTVVFVHVYVYAPRASICEEIKFKGHAPHKLLLVSCARKIASPASFLKVPFIEVLLFVFSYLISATFTDLLPTYVLLKIQARALLNSRCLRADDFRINDLG